MICNSITEVPASMTPHTDDSSKYGYPPGIDHTTMVLVVIEHDGHLSLHSGMAKSFGWSIKAAPASVPGLLPCEAPITHYQVMLPPFLPTKGAP